MAADLPPTDLPSLALVYDELKARLAEQSAQNAAIEGKSSAGLASASILTAVVGVKGSLQKASAVTAWTIFGHPIAGATAIQWLTILAAFAYLAVVVTTYAAHRVRRFQTVPDPKHLLEEYTLRPEETTKEYLAGTMMTVFYDNERLIEAKLRWTRCVLLSLVVEAIMELLLTIVQLQVPSVRTP